MSTNYWVFKYLSTCKLSIGIAGGIGIKAINNLKEVLSTYENLACQEKIIQSKLIDRINPGINSIRTCLYRTRSGKFKVLNNSIRFGVAGSLDNETAGGLVCNIGNNGYLNTYAVKKYCEKHKIHPDSKVSFSDIVIPFYDNLFQVAEMIANQIPLCNLVSLDMCLDINNNWRCIEINLAEQTIRFAQYAGVGFFGDYTDEVIKGVLNESSHSSS